MRRPAYLAFAAMLVWSGAFAQPAQFEISDDVSMETYLALLAQVAPPARDGAEAYLAAFLTRCRRSLTTVELRKAFAVGRGDPILLGMVSAAHRRDTASLQHLGARITCPRD